MPTTEHDRQYDEHVQSAQSAKEYLKESDAFFLPHAQVDALLAIAAAVRSLEATIARRA